MPVEGNCRLLTGQPGMLVPACIVGGIGGMLYWQNLTGDWASWSYSWSLIPLCQLPVTWAAR